jgi:hypothetical protein
LKIKDTLEMLLKTAPVYIPMTLATLSNIYVWDKLAGNPYYHLSGVVSAEIAHTLDDLSSQAVVKQLEKHPNKRAVDVNPLLTNPITMQKYAKSRSIIAPLIGMLGFVSPPTAYTYLAVSPYIVYNNLKIARKIK